MAKKKVVQRLETGIKGLDEILKGGVVKNRNILVCGPCGCGKTSVGLHFLKKGASVGEKCLYVTFEQPRDHIIEDAKKIGVDVEDYRKHGLIKFIGGPIAKVAYDMKKFGAKIDHLMEEIRQIIIEERVTRLVIDSVNLFTLIMKEMIDKRIALARLMTTLSEINCTTMFICEVQEGKNSLSWNGMEEFIADGVIAIYKFREGSRFSFGISIRKMRGSDHDRSTRIMKITNKGVIVYPDEAVIQDV